MVPSELSLLLAVFCARKQEQRRNSKQSIAATPKKRQHSDTRWVRGENEGRRKRLFQTFPIFAPFFFFSSSRAKDLLQSKGTCNVALLVFVSKQKRRNKQLFFFKPAAQELGVVLEMERSGSVAVSHGSSQLVRDVCNLCAWLSCESERVFSVKFFVLFCSLCSLVTDATAGRTIDCSSV